MLEFNLSDNDKSIYFIGIGGISMSGMAEILLSEGFRVSGSDIRDSKVIDRLKKLGAEISIPQSRENIREDYDLVIYTDALSQDNEELLSVKERGLRLVGRAEFLGALMKNYKSSIAISGTHGKTSTTSMLSNILLNDNSIEPTILIGGNLKSISGNVRLGSRDLILTEACEYKANILNYFPTNIVILNVDEDHLDYFKNLKHIIKTFKGFISNLKEDGFLLINKDDKSFEELVEGLKPEDYYSFSCKGDAYFSARNIKYSSKGFPIYDLYIKDEYQGQVSLNVLGSHNISNSLASIGAAYLEGVKIESIIESLASYKTVDRRLEYKGIFQGAMVIDDYAHHPTEIQASLDALSKINIKGKIYCIFQPHTFTRTKLLLDSFAQSFAKADLAIITDIYGAREVDNGSIHSKDLANLIESTESIYIEDFSSIYKFLQDRVKEGDLIVTMGAGNITELSDLLVEGSKE